MGYVNPQQNMRTYLQTMNEQTRRFTTEYNSMFDKVNAEMRTTISTNLAKLEQDRLKKSIGQEAYYEAKRKAAAKLKGGYSKNRDKFLNEIGVKNWEASSMPGLEGIELRNQYLELPKLIAELQGSYVGYKKQYDDALKIKDTLPNSWNPNTSLDIMGFIDDDANHSYSLEDGTLYVDYTYLGKTYHKTAQEIIDASTSGDWGIQTFGDPKAIRTQIHNDKFKNDKVATRYTDVVDKRSSTQTSTRNYDVVNDEYYASIQDPDLYQGVIGVNSEMRRNWPIIVNDAYKTATDPNAKPEQREQMRTLLNPILGGSDGVFGDDPTTTIDESTDDIKPPTYDQKGFDDDPNTPGIDESKGRTLQVNSNSEWVQFYTNQGKAGVWDPNSDNQNALATAWFGSYDKTSGIVTDSRITKIVKTTPGGSNAGGRGGGSSAVTQDQLKKDIRFWLKNSHDLQSRAFGDAPRLWGLDKKDKTNMIPQMNAWLNSEKGLKRFGVIPPKGAEFIIDKRGQVSLLYKGQYDEDGNQVTQSTQIVFNPGETFDTKRNYTTILGYNTKQNRADASDDGKTDDDPDGLGI